MMNRTLDLNVFEQETLDITTVTGNVIHVKKPTEQLTLKLLSYSGIGEIAKKSAPTKEDAQKAVEALSDLTVSILNNNTDGIPVDDSYLKDNRIDYAMQLAIVQAYTEFMGDILSDPNSKSPQNRAQRRTAKK